MGGKPRTQTVSMKMTLLCEDLQTSIDNYNRDSLQAERGEVEQIHCAMDKAADQLERRMHKLIEDALPKEAAQRFREVRSLLDDVRDDMSYD